MAPLKVQPIDIDPQRVKKEAVVVRNDSAKPVLKSRLRRLFVFERQLPSVLRTSSSEKPNAGDGSKDGGAAAELEPSSVCLRNMVHNFMEESNEKQPPPPKCGRNRCNCFNANNDSSDDEEFDAFGGGGGGPGFVESVTDAADLLKSLIPCSSVAERNLLADAAKIVEKNNKVYKQKDDLRKIVTEGLSCLGYDSFICKSKWDKTSSCPAGEYEFIDAIVEGERLIIDIDFRSEFEIARSTGTYKAILQSLPHIFVGKSDRLSQIVTIVSEAAKQSLRKKGMHVPPWRKADYMLAKWLSQSGARPKQPPSSFCACSSVGVAAVPENLPPNGDDNDAATTDSDCGELELIFGEKSSQDLVAYSGETKAEPAVVEVPAWQPPVVKPKSVDRGAKVVPGLASLLNDEP